MQLFECLIFPFTKFRNSSKIASFTLINHSISKKVFCPLKMLNWIFPFAIAVPLIRKLDRAGKQIRHTESKRQVPLWFHKRQQQKENMLNLKWEKKDRIHYWLWEHGGRDAEESFDFISIYFCRPFFTPFLLCRFFFRSFSHFPAQQSALNLLHACKNNWKSSCVKLFLVLPLAFHRWPSISSSP